MTGAPGQHTLGRVLAGLWLAAGLVGLGMRASEGSLVDGGDLSTAWRGGELGRRLSELEGTLDEVEAFGWKRVAFVRSEGANPMISLATHRLFPAQVVPIWQGQKDLDKGLASARKLGLDGLIRFGPNGKWQALPVGPDEDAAP